MDDAAEAEAEVEAVARAAAAVVGACGSVVVVGRCDEYVIPAALRCETIRTVGFYKDLYGGFRSIAKLERFARLSVFRLSVFCLFFSLIITYY